MSGERNVAGAFPLDQPNRRWEEVVDYNKCVICQDIPDKSLMNIKLASVPKLSETIIFVVDMIQCTQDLNNCRQL